MPSIILKKKKFCSTLPINNQSVTQYYRYFDKMWLKKMSGLYNTISYPSKIKSKYLVNHNILVDHKKPWLLVIYVVFPQYQHIERWYALHMAPD